MLLIDVLHAPGIRRNLISVAKLLQDKIDITFKGSHFYVCRNNLNFCGNLSNDLFVFDGSFAFSYSVIVVDFANLSMK